MNFRRNSPQGRIFIFEDVAHSRDVTLRMILKKGNYWLCYMEVHENLKSGKKRRRFLGGAHYTVNSLRDGMERLQQEYEAWAKSWQHLPPPMEAGELIRKTGEAS